MNWRAIAAGALGALMAGSTLAFAADLGDFPVPFVEDSTVNALFVVGGTAATDDVVGAINIAARLGGAPITEETVSVPGVAGTLSIDGEGKALATKSTKIFLDDNLGKTGLRTTLTDDDLPTILKDGSVTDNNGTSYRYQQFIDMTPGSGGTAANYALQFDRPGSSSTADGAYNFGRFPTSPTGTATGDNFYRSRVVFGTNLLGDDSIGSKLELFGGEYTIASGTDLPNNKLVLFGGAETHILNGGESVTVTIGGTTYTVTLDGTVDADTLVVRVGSDKKSIDKSKSQKVGGLDVFVSDVFHLSSTDQTQNSGKIILGAQKITLQNGNKVKLGENEDPVDGTIVTLTRPSDTERLSQIEIGTGGRSSSVDFAKTGDMYEDPAWKTFALAFPGVDPDLTDSSRNTYDNKPSGDNLLQTTWTDNNGKSATINWAYKGSSTATAFSLAGSAGNNIQVLEQAETGRDEYVILDAGDFPHMFRVTGVSLDGSTSGSVELNDLFSGATTKITTGSDNQEAAVIDGQTYNIFNISSNNFTVTWGNNSNISSTVNGRGTFTTVYPRLKGKNGEYVAFFKNVSLGTYNTVPNNRIQLPTGAIEISPDTSAISTHRINITAINKEDGSASALSASDTVTGVNTTSSPSVTFTLGRTANAGVRYQLTFNNATNASTLAVVGEGTGTAPLAQPGYMVVEEKDDAGNINTVIFTASTETSGSNNVAIPSAPIFTATEDSQTRGSDSNVIDYVDIWGTYVARKTSGQDTSALYYPDDQSVAHIAVVKKGSTATISSGGAAGDVTTEKVVPIKTGIAKLDTEVTQADKNTKNLILVGGPAVNELVRELGDAAKTWTREQYIDAGAGTAIIQFVEDAFASGQSALIVAGHSAADTRSASSMMQNYDAHSADFAGRTGVLVENGAITGELTV